MQKKIGILSAKEDFTEAILNKINKIGEGSILAEFCKLPYLKICRPKPYYDVIIDRASHCIEFFSPFLKQVALQGTYVINNPFKFPADDKFFNNVIADKLGISIPKTYCLPSFEHSEYINNEDLQNIDLPVKWDEIIEDLGFPAILKPYDGYGWVNVFKVNSKDELIEIYEQTGQEVMLLQQYIEFDHYVRAFAIGTEEVLPIKYNPSEREYIVDHEHLSAEMGEIIVEQAKLINKVLGYDINTIEFAIKENIPYAIDFMNPVPEAKPHSLKEYFPWVVERVSQFAVKCAIEERKTPYLLKN